MGHLKSELCEVELIQKDIVFIDGLTRVGKSMLNVLIASLDKLSHPQFFEPLEQLLPVYRNGHMNKNSLSSFLRLQLNEKFYNFYLSRNLNFRYDDLTSIHNSNNHRFFLENLSKSDGDIIIDDLSDNKIIHQFQTHDVLTQYNFFLDLNINVKIIELFRNPIDTIHSWYKRGWGIRFDKEDPRSFTSLFRFKGKTMPHYAIGYEEKYFTLNEMEKCIFLHNILLKKSISEYQELTLKQKENLLLIKFEDVLSNPDLELDKICFFLNSSKTVHTNKALLKANVPRDIHLEKREEKLSEIKRKVSEDLYDDLLKIENQYNNKLYKLL